MTLNEFNKQFNDETYPMLPPISKNSITIITKGLYRKPDANFRGVTAKLLPGADEYSVQMNGMYNILKDIVIVPDNVSKKLNSKKLTLLNSCLAAGYEEVSKLMHYKQITYPLDSEVGKMALANLTTYNTTVTNK